jgi:polar amino acid transport system substrate-binding protein
MFMHTHTIQAVSTDQWPPLNFSAKTPLEGIAVDVWREVCSLSGITQQLTVASTWSEVLEKIRSKSADVTLGTSISSEKEKYALFSKPYATFPNVIVTSKSFGYVPGLTSLNGKRIAIGVDYTIADQIAKHYPQIRIVDAKNTSDALAMLHAGQVDAVIDILPVVAYLVNTENYLDIQISGTTEFSSELRFMIRNDYPQLKSIIDKSIDAMSAEKKEMMLSRYIGVMYVHPTDYTWVYRIAGLFLFLFGVFIYRQLEMGKYNKKLLKMATTDPLTQLFNRIQLDEKLQESYATYQRTHRPFSIIMLDIDYFKRVNDTYGHLVGDKILVAFASILNNTTRDTDIVGRWGGEEFMIICPETDKKGALSVAEKVRNAVNEYDFEEIHTMTSSFGISEYQQHERIEKMVKRADDAMYTAKEAGRDRIVVL